MKLNIKIMAEVAIFAAIGWVLNILCDSLTAVIPFLKAFWLNGGSITLAYIPIVIISFRRGCKAGILTGVLMMLLGFINGFYSIASTWYKVFLQLMLDYFLAWPLVGVCGLFKKAYDKADKKMGSIIITIGLSVGGFLKFLCHFFAGYLFWGDYAPEGQAPVLYSFLYNGSQVLFSVIVCIVICIILNYKHQEFFKLEEQQ